MPTDGRAAVLIALAALAAAGVHLTAPRLRQRLFPSEAVAESVFAGLSAAYVFVVLLPELDTGHEVLGDLIFLVVLAAFVTLYGIEHLAGDGRGRAAAGMFWLRTASLGATTLLFVVTVPEHLHERPTFFVLTVGGAALGLAVHSYDVFSAHPTLHQRVGRWVLVAAAGAGAVIDLFLPPPSEVVVDLLVAVLAGFVLLKAMVGRELEHARTRFAPFLAGVGLYVALFLTRPLHPL